MPAATTLAMAASSRRPEPAIVPSARRGSPSGSTETCWPPRSYVPGGMPAAATASVTSMIRPGAAANASRQTGTATWCRSAISPQVNRGSVSACPTSPGSRWCSGRIALKRWVTSRAPASAAASV